MAQQVRAGECLRLSLEGWGRLGEAVAWYDGTEVLVFGGIPGEEVIAEVIKQPRQYIAARVVEVLAASPHRVAPPCPYFGPCTGCQWQHVAYNHQLQLKEQMVRGALGRVGSLGADRVTPIVAAPQQLWLPQPCPVHRGAEEWRTGLRESRESQIRTREQMSTDGHAD